MEEDEDTPLQSRRENRYRPVGERDSNDFMLQNRYEPQLLNGQRISEEEENLLNQEDLEALAHIAIDQPPSIFDESPRNDHDYEP